MFQLATAVFDPIPTNTPQINEKESTWTWCFCKTHHFDRKTIYQYSSRRRRLFFVHKLLSHCMYTNYELALQYGDIDEQSRWIYLLYSLPNLRHCGGIEDQKILLGLCHCVNFTVWTLISMYTINRSGSIGPLRIWTRCQGVPTIGGPDRTIRMARRADLSRLNCIQIATLPDGFWTRFQKLLPRKITSVLPLTRVRCNAAKERHANVNRTLTTIVSLSNDWNIGKTYVLLNYSLENFQNKTRRWSPINMRNQLKWCCCAVKYW